MIPYIIFWYIFHVVSTILGGFTAFMVLKYLNKKPLGMQTVFDEIIKDFIYLNMLDWLIFVATDIAVRFFAPLNHYAISTMIVCKVTVKDGSLILPVYVTKINPPPLVVLWVSRGQKVGVEYKSHLPSNAG